MVGMYRDAFRFDRLAYRTVPGVALAAVAAVAAGAALGAFAAIRAVLRLSPAQAMLPPAPPRFRRTLLERLGAARAAGPAVLMVVRNLERRPLRALLTVVGTAAAVALQVCGLFWHDTIDRIVEVQYRQVEQGDVMLSLATPADAAGTLAGLARLPGVVEAQVYRVEPVPLHAFGRRADTTLTGFGAGSDRLLRVVDRASQAHAMPAEGLLVTALLARELGVRAGDAVELEFRLWHRRRVRTSVAAVVPTLFGQQAFMALPAMNALAGDGPGAAEAVLRIDPREEEAFHAAVKRTPRIAAVFDKAGSLRSFKKTTARNIGWFTAVLTAFAVAMAVGITYNAARIALSERAWELASLRVLGMTRREVSVLLLAELAAELLLALPLGALLGRALAGGLVRAMQSDQIDFPVVVSASSYGLAALSVLAAGLLSALVVRRRIDRLDLVAVLKVRE
jgi:putative ABC transport system permease protein